MNKKYNELDESEKEEVKLDFINKQQKFYDDFMDFMEDKASLSPPIPICKCLLDFVTFNMNCLQISKDDFFNLADKSWEETKKLIKEEGSDDNF
jgi:hypothetical protein